MRINLPDSCFYFYPTDVDNLFTIQNGMINRIMMLEVKRNNKQIPQWQKICFDRIDKWIKKGIEKDWEYSGFHYLTFEHYSFTDGKCYFDGIEKTEQEIKHILSSLKL
jgi:hypothetical protein